MQANQINQNHPVPEKSVKSNSNDQRHLNKFITHSRHLKSNPRQHKNKFQPLNKKHSLSVHNKQAFLVKYQNSQNQILKSQQLNNLTFSNFPTGKDQVRLQNSVILSDISNNRSLQISYDSQLIKESEIQPIRQEDRKDRSIEQNKLQNILDKQLLQELNANEKQDQGDALYKLTHLQDCDRVSAVDKRSNATIMIQEQIMQKLSLFIDPSKVNLIKSIIKKEQQAQFSQQLFNKYYREIKLQDFVEKQIKQNLIESNKLELYEQLRDKLTNQQEQENNYINFNYLLHLNDWALQKNNKQQCVFDQIFKYAWDDVIVLRIDARNFTDDDWKQLVECHKFKNLKILLLTHGIRNINFSQLKELKQNTQLKFIKFYHQDYSLSRQSQLQILKYGNDDREIIIDLTYDIVNSELRINGCKSIDLDLIFNPLTNSDKVQLKNVKYLDLNYNNIWNDEFLFIIQNISTFQNLSNLNLMLNNITQIKQEDLIKLYAYKLNALQKQKQKNLIQQQKSEANQSQHQAQNIQHLTIDIENNKLDRQSYLLIQKYSFLSLSTIIRFQYDYNEQFSQQQAQKKKLLSQYSSNYSKSSRKNIIGMIYQLIINKKSTTQLKQLLINQIPEAVNYTIEFYRQLKDYNQDNNQVSKTINQLYQIVVNDATNTFQLLKKQYRQRIKKKQKYQQQNIEQQFEEFQNLYISKLKQYLPKRSNSCIVVKHSDLWKHQSQEERIKNLTKYRLNKKAITHVQIKQDGKISSTSYGNALEPKNEAKEQNTNQQYKQQFKNINMLVLQNKSIKKAIQQFFKVKGLAIKIVTFDTIVKGMSQKVYAIYHNMQFNQINFKLNEFKRSGVNNKKTLLIVSEESILCETSLDSKELEEVNQIFGQIKQNKQKLQYAEDKTQNKAYLKAQSKLKGMYLYFIATSIGIKSRMKKVPQNWKNQLVDIEDVIKQKSEQKRNTQLRIQSQNINSNAKTAKSYQLKSTQRVLQSNND